jgi:cell division transport system permease protein
MSMREGLPDRLRDHPVLGELAGRLRAAKAADAAPAPLMPRNSMASRSLMVVVGIMTFLSVLTLGTVTLLRDTARAWDHAVEREATIQVRPMPGRDIEIELGRAAELARSIPGIAATRVLSAEESRSLVEPWIGTLSLETLPVPRMIVLTRTGVPIDAVAVQRKLAERVPGARFDDHRAWTDRLATASRTAVGVGVSVLVLMLAATGLTVAFATQSVMALGHRTIDVLQIVGASRAFIGAEIEQHVLHCALVGALAGTGLAVLLFFGLEVAHAGPAGGDGALPALLGRFAISPAGYAGMAGIIVLVVALSVGVTRLAVARALDRQAAA